MSPWAAVSCCCTPCSAACSAAFSLRTACSRTRTSFLSTRAFSSRRRVSPSCAWASRSCRLASACSSPSASRAVSAPWSCIRSQCRSVWHVSSSTAARCSWPLRLQTSCGMSSSTGVGPTVALAVSRDGAPPPVAGPESTEPTAVAGPGATGSGAGTGPGSTGLTGPTAATGSGPTAPTAVAWPGPTASDRSRVLDGALEEDACRSSRSASAAPAPPATTG
mmetsp:Transcript_34372/g.61600  ORF Transcript_34372/g.61600 Transcript_34372/m.61600 type:complete len:221 (-) Transcript_34372:172-834(-)